MKIDPNERTRARRSLTIALTLVLMSVVSFGQARQQSLSTLDAKGYFDRVAILASDEIKKHSNAGRTVEASQVAVLACRSYIQLGRYDEATRMLDYYVENPRLKSQSSTSIASLYLCKASVARAKRDFSKAFETLRLAITVAPNDPATLAGYQLEVGRTLYSVGYDFAAIIWLEKAEKTAQSNGYASIYYDALRFLSLAWTAKFYYANALNYSEKLVEKSSRGEFEHRNRIAYLELANLLDVTGQQQRAKAAYLIGLELSLRAKVNYHTGQFLSALLHRELFENRVETAEKYLRQLEAMDTEKQFTYECLLGKALVAHYRGNKSLSDQYFAKLKDEASTSEFVVPYWKTMIAERDKNWKELIDNAEFLRKATEESNFQDDLPGIYYKLALGSWRLGNEKAAKDHARKALSLFEPFRSTSIPNLSIAMIEVHHSIYRLLSEIEAVVDIHRAFEYSEQLKASLLRDRIERSSLNPRPDLSESFRSQLLTASKNFVDGKHSDEVLAHLEKSVVAERQSESRLSQDFSTNGLKLPDDTAIVSYEFTSSGSLLAFIIESAATLRVVELNVVEEQVSQFANETRSKINDRIFFKSDGKKLYDLLLKPLALRSRHLVIVPDKLLWRIPFQALSPDGNKYLIETNSVSYSPSVYVLKQLLSSKPIRRKTIQIFANDTFNNRRLAYVNSEAQNIGNLFATTPRLRATKADFIKNAQNSDVLHFSMHAQLDSDNPLSSFLAFHQDAKDTGRLTVQDLLSIRLKPKSLTFLASCDTTRVFNGEGAVSIPWAILGSGSSTVISSQWEASDKATQDFSLAFYREYLTAHSTAQALQNAAISAIHNKSAGFHEPFYWASFTLLGDFR